MTAHRLGARVHCGRGNWRLMAFGCLAAAGLAGDQSGGRPVAPSRPGSSGRQRLGQAQAVAPARCLLPSTDPQIAFHLALHRGRARLPADAVVLRPTRLAARLSSRPTAAPGAERPPAATIPSPGSGRCRSPSSSFERGRASRTVSAWPGTERRYETMRPARRYRALGPPSLTIVIGDAARCRSPQRTAGCLRKRHQLVGLADASRGTAPFPGRLYSPPARCPRGIMLISPVSIAGCASITKPTANRPKACRRSLSPVPHRRSAAVVARSAVLDAGAQRAVEAKEPIARVEAANGAALSSRAAMGISTPCRSILARARFIRSTSHRDGSPTSPSAGEQLTRSGPVAAAIPCAGSSRRHRKRQRGTRRVHILVKPTRPAMRTNLVVINTDRRTYLIELRAPRAAHAVGRLVLSRKPRQSVRAAPSAPVLPGVQRRCVRDRWRRSALATRHDDVRSYDRASCRARCRHSSLSVRTVSRRSSTSVLTETC